MSSRFILAAMIAVFAAHPLSAATHVWNGSASNLFSDAANWDGGSPSGDAAAELSFPKAVRQSLRNDIEGLAVRSITFATDGYTIRGHAITLVDGAEVDDSVGAGNEISCELLFDGERVVRPSGGRFKYMRARAETAAASPGVSTDAMSGVLTFETNAVTARVTPGAATSWLSLGRRGSDSGTIIENRRARLSDADHDGLVRWQLPSPVPLVSIWCVVDESARTLHGARGDGTAVEPRPLDATFLRDETGSYSWVEIPNPGPSLIPLMWVRPGVGAWTHVAADGGGNDHDRGYDLQLLFRVTSMQAVGSSPPPPAGVQPGDMLLGIDRHYSFGFFGGVVDEQLAASRAVPPLVEYIDSRLEEREGKGIARFLRTGSTAGVTTFDYNIVDDSAKAGVHYTATSGKVTFRRGELFKEVAIPLIDDDVYSGAAALRLNVTNVMGAAFRNSPSLQLTITDDDPLPSISSAGVSFPEGDAGEQQGSVAITLSGKTRVPATVEWGTALAGPLPRQERLMVFAPGETEKFLTVRWQGDTRPERDEEYAVYLTANDATVVRSPVVYIVDDDSLGITPAGSTVSEAAGTALVVVTLSAAHTEPVSVSYQIGSSYAHDLTSVSGRLTFMPGEMRKEIAVPITQDTVVEDEEHFFLALSQASPNALIRRATATVTIVDDDTIPLLELEDRTVEEGTDVHYLLFPSSNVLQKTMNLRVSIIAGTTEGRSDHESYSRTFALGPNVPQYFYVAVFDDSVAEPDETFTIEISTLSNPPVVVATATVVIKDNDGVPALTVGDDALREGSAGHALFEVRLTNASESPVTFHAATVGDTAEADRDFEAVSRTITIPPGQLSAVVAVPIIDDKLDEAPETFAVQLSQAVNATIGGGVGRARITDDDPRDAPMTPTITVADVATPEQATAVKFVVTLSAPASTRWSLSYATVNGSAIADEDYTAANGTLTFELGQISKIVEIPIANDTRQEDNETFTLRLVTDSGAVGDHAEAICTIVDDDVKARGRTRSVRH